MEAEKVEETEDSEYDIILQDEDKIMGDSWDDNDTPKTETEPEADMESESAHKEGAHPAGKYGENTNQLGPNSL